MDHTSAEKQSGCKDDQKTIVQYEPSTSPTSGDGATQKPYTVLSERAKIATILLVATINGGAFFASTVYYPALHSISKDLNVSFSNIYLTITAYLIIQGIAPMFTGSISDRKGRRPILFISMLIFIATSIGLACQNNFAVLMALRCLQSIGMAGVFAPTLGLVVDIIARSQRGKYMIYMTMGSTIGTSTGPIIGGALTKALGWRSIFWETCRAVVGNGSIPPPAWNRPLLYRNSLVAADFETQTIFSSPPGILDCFRMLFNKQTGLLIFFWSSICWGQIVIEVSLPRVLGEKYHLDPLQVGLCYIPWAVGAITARWSVGSLADWNFRRHGRKVGVDVQPNRQTKEQLEILPLERIRLDIAIPAVYLVCIFTAAYTWALSSKVHISCPLVLLFFLGNTIAGAVGVTSALIMDLKAYTPGTARGAMAIFRSLPAAGITAAINPAIASIGFGWLGTIFCGFWVIASSILWLVYFRGHSWRTNKET
ncbi:hypothetical protein N7456_003521 [Penicillium angulare]|uniref:Major facilitator superfamily (MFS) profile domain-containing protein n=1 Tax=Penicillium angulare TaxID=116970 RepID=A0A9W9KIB2_9EURO|nr:hypothetical protein N7456_003521 [Penicillium angulare]